MKTVLANIFLVSAIIGLSAAVPARKSSTAVSERNAKLPAHYMTCSVKMETSKYNKCMENAIQSAIISMASGEKAFRIKSIDPFLMSPISAVVNLPSLTLDEKYTNVKLVGFTKGLKLSNFKVDWDRLDIQITAFAPKLLLMFNHRLVGKFGLLGIDGTGNGTISIYELTANIRLKGSKFERNGETFLRINDFKVQCSPKSIHFDISSLADSGSKETNDIILSAVNGAADELFRDLKPDIEKAFGRDFKGLSNFVFSNVPFKNIFIDS